MSSLFAHLLQSLVNPAAGAPNQQWTGGTAPQPGFLPLEEVEFAGREHLLLVRTAVEQRQRVVLGVMNIGEGVNDVVADVSKRHGLNSKR